MERWVEETLHRGFRVRLSADRVLFDSETEHQRLIIFENSDFGRVMMLDSIVQLTTKDEFVYHEMMSHVPLFAHGRAKKALIVGGGDGGVLREALRHPELEQVTLCEIDRGVIDLCRQYFPEISAGAYDNPRSRIVIADGTKFVADTEERFDVIMVDSTDPIGPGAVLFTREFYADCRRRRAQAKHRLFRRDVSGCLRLPRHHAELFRRPDVVWLGDRRHRFAAPPRERHRASLRRGRLLPDALLAPRRPRRGLRAPQLRPRTGRGVDLRFAPLWATRRRAGGNRRGRRRSRRSSLR